MDDRLQRLHWRSAERNLEQMEPWRPSLHSGMKASIPTRNGNQINELQDERRLGAVIDKTPLQSDVYSARRKYTVDYNQVPGCSRQVSESGVHAIHSCHFVIHDAMLIRRWSCQLAAEGPGHFKDLGKKYRSVGATGPQNASIPIRVSKSIYR
uniref:Uncharacterized protein n=1 Tax=Trichuris muris TaxID=70415 RepID=A0A5S6QQJ2_TRIMR